MKRLAVTAAMALMAAFAGPAVGQVVREDGVKSIAGVLDPDAAYAEWKFLSAGEEVVFASLDADIYRIQTEHESAAAFADEGCGDEDGGCGDDAGPGLFRLTVLDAAGNALCSASRPAPPPGWQRDPRLACPLPATRSPQQYWLRVDLSLVEDEVMQESYPFLLNVSIRRIAPSGVSIAEAFARSGSGGF